MNPKQAEPIQLDCISGESCRLAWERSGRDPGHLARFLKKYPAAFYLGWVQAEISRLFALGEFDALKSLHPGRGERKEDAGLRAAFLDFQIYRAVVELQKQGANLTSNSGGSGSFAILEEQSFMGLSEGQLRRRYYRFVNAKPARIFDDEKNLLIVGPAKIELNDTQIIGFWQYKQ